MASHYDDHLSVSFSANSGGNNRVLMMDNGMVAGEDENLETSEAQPLLQQRYEQKKEARKKKLGMIFGVTLPCILSIFSVILFLRLGMVVGQAGYLESLLMLVIGYGVVVLTVLSISAIATNGNVEGGGVYFMISRALGPEFGGSIGVIFVIANIFSSATYIIGFVEALLSNLGKGGSLVAAFFPCNNGTDQSECTGVFPGGYWEQLGYGSVILMFCLVVCLVGAGLFAKTTFFIFLAVMFSVATVMFSFGYQIKPDFISPPSDNDLIYQNESLIYTGFSYETFRDNLKSNYTEDYTSGKHLSFQAVFAIMFNGCTGIMAGANISGDLKNPSVSIPQGTLLACGITFFIYIILFTMTAFTCDRDLLLYNYNYLQDINVFPVFITIGVFAATLSAALSTLIGASRVLHALSKDRLFSGVLHPFTWTVGKQKEPIVSVLFSWALVQATLFIGTLNAIAPIVTMFYLLSYGIVNLACFAMKLASAPNFRPTFHAYSRTTSIFGALGCVALMFYIQPLYAAITLVIMILLFLFLLIRSPATPWGDVSQALIYHQVRKYLLRLDIRKTHIKFWRPEILLMVANPRSDLRAIQFCNDLKKGGLYVMGHVIKQPFTSDVAEYYNKQLKTWLDFVEISKFKAFVELTIADNVRQGTRSLLTSAGLGGMKPNILALGFYDNSMSVDCLDDLKKKFQWKPKVIRTLTRDESYQKYHRICEDLPPLRQSDGDHTLSMEEYTGMIEDAVIMGKNVCVLRNFQNFVPQSGRHGHIDVWPHRVKFNEEFDNTFTLLLQLACVLQMKGGWKNHWTIRIFIVMEDVADVDMETEIVKDFLKESRIEAEVQFIPFPTGEKFSTFTDSFTARATRGRGLEYYNSINSTICEHSKNANVVFTALPSFLSSTSSKDYINLMTSLSNGLPPVVMVYGSMSVLTNSL